MVSKLTFPFGLKRSSFFPSVEKWGFSAIYAKALGPKLTVLFQPNYSLTIEFLQTGFLFINGHGCLPIFIYLLTIPTLYYKPDNKMEAPV